MTNKGQTANEGAAFQFAGCAISLDDLRVFLRQQARQCKAPREDVDDLVQETLVLLTVHASRIEEPFAYGREVMRRLCQKYHVKSRRKGAVESPIEDLDGYEPQVEGTPLDTLAKRRAFSLLSDPDRELMLRVGAGESVGDLAAERHLASGALRTRIHRLRQRLQQSL